MTKTRIALASSDAASSVGLGVARRSVASKRPMKITGYELAPRVADWASDAQVYIFGGYTGDSSNLVNSGDFTADLAAAAEYTSDFSGAGDGWADGGATNPTITFNETVGSVSECMKVLDVGGADKLELVNLTKCTNATMYKLTFDYFAETGITLVALGLGADGDAWDLGYDHNAGQHVAITGDDTWKTGQVLYGLSDGTTLELCAYTAINSQTADVFGAGKYIAFKNLVLTEVTNDSDWTRSDDTKGYWDMKNGVADFDGSGAATLTYAGSGGGANLVANKLYKSVVTASNFTAGDVWISWGGVTGEDLDVDGTYTDWAPATASTGLVINGDATGDADVDNVALYEIAGVNFSNPLYKTTIVAATVGPVRHEFPSPLWVPDGWYMYVTSGGATVITDVNVFYEIV
jgi:hypothetical protein